MSRIYFDHNATTPLDPSVLSAMLVDLSTHPYNPSSVHYYGQKAKKFLIQARQKIAKFLKVTPTEIIFTSGGTEGLNFLIHSILQNNKSGNVISTKIEHAAIYQTLLSLASEHLHLKYLPVKTYGSPQIEDLENAIDQNTKLLVFSAVNNETGVKLDLQAFAFVAKRYNIPLIIDGVALLGKEPFTIPEGVTGMVFSGHKIHAPKGIGFVYLRANTKCGSWITGGGQEQKLRSGTENLSGILGLAKAIELLDQNVNTYAKHMQTMRDLFEQELQQNVQDIYINGSGPRVSNTSNLFFEGVDGESLLIQLDLHKIAASHASACSSGALQPSRVLSEMGYHKERVSSSIRFSFSRMTTEEEIRKGTKIIAEIVSKMRAMSHS